MAMFIIGTTIACAGAVLIAGLAWQAYTVDKLQQERDAAEMEGRGRGF